MKKVLAICIVLCIMTILFVGCGNQSSSKTDTSTQKVQVDKQQKTEEPKKQEEQITINAFFNSLDHQTYLKPVNEGFMKKYPNIKLEFDTPGSTAYETVLKTKLASGEAPDMMSVWPGGLMADYAAAGHLLDITGQPYTDRLTELVKNEYTFKGKLYGVGWNATA